MSALILAAALAAASDTPLDYSHVIPLTVSGKQSVVQLQVPRAVYLNAYSSDLRDLRVFDARGVVQPFALRQPEAAMQTSHRSLAVRVFPLMADSADGELAGLEVSTGSDGRVLSVRLPATKDAARPRQQLAALVLDLRQNGEPDAETPLIDALRFQLPAGRSTYTGQVWLESSNDLKSWEAVGMAELSWLANASDETLANDRLEFAPRRMRYARLRWRGGEPVQFASITAEVPVQSEAPATAESLLLPAQPGREARDLQYTKPPGVPATRAGLQLDGGAVVLPATLGRYREQARKGRSWFEPVLRTTFYRLERDGKPYESAAIFVPPYLGGRWVLRFDQPPAISPALRVSWQPATLVFLAGGTPPYSLAVGRDKAISAERPMRDVAPGFTAAELRALEQARPGAAQLQGDVLAAAAKRADADAASATRRLVLLWGVLLLGVAVVAAMVWRLLRQAGSKA
ncbi:MAG TPA: DUF3999 family protein [Pseudoduganella sp.]